MVYKLKNAHRFQSLFPNKNGILPHEAIWIAY